MQVARTPLENRVTLSSVHYGQKLGMTAAVVRETHPKLLITVFTEALPMAMAAAHCGPEQTRIET